MTWRRAWHGAQVSSSLGERSAPVQCLVAAPGASAQPFRSTPSGTASPFEAGVGAGPAGRDRAHATWFDPGPWQTSQATSISDHVVVYRSAARSYPLRRFVEWHSAH